MKPYFAEYLPIEGEIKDGDYWIRDGKISNEVVAHGMCDCKKVKLFLCSRNIQVGDTPYGYDDMVVDKVGNELEGFHIKEVDNDYGYWITNIFKKIGEISPDSLSFVKRGDEFDEEQLLWQARSNEGDIEDIEDWGSKKVLQDDYGYYTVAIKGPCGHFH